MIRKNKKFIDPRYFMEEKVERVLNEGRDIGGALHKTLLNNNAKSPEMAMDLEELFGDNGLVWGLMRDEFKISDEEIQQSALHQKPEFYNNNGGRIATEGGKIVHWAKTGMRGQDKIYIDL